jgi:hypothetical protein
MYMYWENFCKLKQTKKIIFVFLVLTIVSSLLSSVAFVTDNNLAFASSKKKDDSGGGGGGGGGSGSGSSDNAEGSDNSNDAGSSTDNTSTTTAPEENTAPPPSQTQQTCPDDSIPDANGACNTTQSSPPTNALNAQQPTGVPPECQGIVAGPSDKCSLATPPSSTDSASTGPPLTPQQQYEQCLKGIGGGIPGNCKPPPATLTGQNVAPLQTLTPQQTCKDGSTPNANGICQDGSTPQQTCKGDEVLSAKGNCVSPGEAQAIKNGTLVDLGNGKFELGTRPPVPNTNTIAPICPSDSHLVGSKCVVNGAGCPSGTLQDDGDITCSPFKQVQVPVNPDGSCPEGSYSVGSSGNAGQPGTGSTFCFKNVRVEPPCDQPDFIRFHGICYQGKETVPNPDGNCPPTTPILFEGRCLDKLPVLPGTSTGSGGGFIQMFPVKPPPAAPPTNTPPVQPQAPQQLAPSQPECEPGFHWDNAQLKCVAG